MASSCCYCHGFLLLVLVLVYLADRFYVHDNLLIYCTASRVWLKDWKIIAGWSSEDLFWPLLYLCRLLSSSYSLFWILDSKFLCHLKCLKLFPEEFKVLVVSKTIFSYPWHQIMSFTVEHVLPVAYIIQCVDWWKLMKKNDDMWTLM